MLNSSIGDAQHHYNAWMRGSASYSFNQNFSTNLELQYRMQNGFGNENICDKQLMQSARLWLNYQPSKQLLVAFSPFAVFKHSRIIQRPEDEKAKPIGEYRTTTMLKFQKELDKKLVLTTSTKAEYRTFDNQVKDILRLRQLVGLSYRINDKVEAIVSDEVFVNVLGVSSIHFFDQNRIMLQFAFTPKPKWKLEAGYIHINRMLSSTVDILEDENFFVNLNYKIR